MSLPQKEGYPWIHLFCLFWLLNHFSLADCESLLEKDTKKAVKTDDHSKHRHTTHSPPLPTS